MRKIALHKVLSFRSRVVIIILGLVIGLSSLWFANNMARQLRDKEQNEVSIWAEAFRELGVDPGNPLLISIISTRNTIPFILTDGSLQIKSSNLIPEHILNHPDLLREKIDKMAHTNPHMKIETLSNDVLYLFYDESRLLKTLVYFPYIQLLVILVFVIFGYITFRSTKQDEQNRVWIGLAKETAHQLGTPTSSLLGWLEYLRTQEVDPAAIEEMNKDLIRLTKVVDRFSKIGAATPLTEGVLNEMVGGSVIYFRTRVPRNVTISYNGLAMERQRAMVNEALFEWVIENLLKNAMDALSGVGTIDVHLSSDANWIYVDVKDSGKGIAKGNFKRIFEPGFTTKTRGWGLGLSLSKRIIEGYHGGKIFVLESEIDKGTTIRIALKRLYS
ncbi:MAG: ATP-binding protein [Alistipes sp.]|nr:ATP-binding protein [Alistipes sp.]